MYAAEPLPHPWHAWRRDRRAELTQFGAPPLLAAEVAEREAAARMRIARIVGDQAAITAELVSDPRDDSRFLLQIQKQEVPSAIQIFAEMAADGETARPIRKERAGDEAARSQ